MGEAADAGARQVERSGLAPLKGGSKLHPVSLERGVFTLSLDFELIWGRLDLLGPEAARQACERERSQVFASLVTLLEEFEISATWCVVGHIMLGSCAPVNGRKHPEIVRPRHSWHRDDWFTHDPCGDERIFPAFYGRSLVERLLACRTPQEIGSHSFSHPIFGDEGCSRETAASELRACVRAAGDLGIDLRSFAFPRNSVGHLDVLREHGFACFRGPEPTWHGTGRGTVRRLGHLIDVLGARRPPVTLPVNCEGLVNVPASLIFFPSHGLRRYIPASRRVRRILKGVERAERERRVLHLWFHPTNLAYETETMLKALEAVFQEVTRRRDRGALDVMTMGQLAERVSDA